MKTKFNRSSLIWLLTVGMLGIWAVFADVIITDRVFQSVWASSGSIATVSYESQNFNNTWYFIFWDTTDTWNFNLTISWVSQMLTCHEKLYWYYINPFWWDDRSRPLNGNTLTSITANDGNFAWLTINWWLFTSCTNEWIDPYAIFGYIEYSYTNSNNSKIETWYKIWVWVSWLNTDYPTFENALFLIGWGEDSDLSASGWIFDSVSSTGIVSPYSEGNFSDPRPWYLWNQSINFEFLAPAYKSWDDLW